MPKKETIKAEMPSPRVFQIEPGDDTHVDWEKLNPKYHDNYQLWVRDLRKHYAMLKDMALGEEGEWRREVDFLISRTKSVLEFAELRLRDQEFLNEKGIK